MFEDKTLTCVDCEVEFVFSSDEQSQFEERGFQSEPKRCKECRKKRRDARRSKRKTKAPSTGKRQAGSRPPKNREYRSPAFRHIENQGQGEYRSPAFQQYGLDAQSEYRAPGFQDFAGYHRDERPMFVLDCPACGERKMVPFLPDERENPVCVACESGLESGVEAEG
ncbi:MAG: zinc-ribbon domain-containing protein [Myxococcales bacterium]|nr:zinc-ribbon domain-containing protein [Myxococcales bacterium]